MPQRFAKCFSAFALALATVLALSCAASSPSKKTPRHKAVSVFVTTELRGTIEPCGCNSDPLGDIARTVELIEAARRGKDNVVVIDGGSLLYTEPSVPEYLAGQEALKSDLIASIYTERLGVAAVGLGPYDLGAGPARVRPARQAANVPAKSGIATAPPRVVKAGGIDIGLFGVVSPAALSPFGIAASDPAEAAAAAVSSLRSQGAQVVIGLAHMTQRDAAALAKSVSGIDFLVVGRNAPEPDAIKTTAIQVGDTFLVAPANRGQILSRVDITWRGAGPLSDAVGEARAAIEITSLGERIQALSGDLAKWSADPSADPGFVAGKRDELAAMEARKKTLETSPTLIPEQGSFFTLEQIAIRKALPCNVEIQSAKTRFDKAAGQANVKAAANKKAPPPAAGKASYVGAAACQECHEEAVEFWNKTRHGKAWETLTGLGKELDYECIGCHVTGWDQPGGATLAFNQHLQDVQCETCHGPGSIHVAEEGSDEPVTVARIPPESLCQTCHNKEHSDTFEYTAYLRTITGPDHGEEFRQGLGDGPTGRELRKAALEKAGRSIGTGCIK